ncbi:MAG TPA: hypothetical protein VEX68_30460 [Bryobacteraceae bacterium]|nr:hypothetical protein [Bryobacteraceae bacterium]
MNSLQDIERAIDSLKPQELVNSMRGLSAIGLPLWAHLRKAPSSRGLGCLAVRKIQGCWMKSSNSLMRRDDAMAVRLPTFDVQGPLGY